MSTILKALQRLEDEKSANSERSLDEQVVAHRPPPEPQRRGLKIGAVAIAGLAIAGAAYMFWPTQEGSDADVAMESPPPAEEPAAAATEQSTAATERKAAVEKKRRRRSARPAPAAREQEDPSEVEVSSVVEVVRQLDEPPADPDASASSRNRAAPAGETFAERLSRRSNERDAEPDVAPVVAQPRPDPRQVANAEPPVTQSSENSAPAKPVRTPPRPAAAAPKPAPKPTLAAPEPVKVVAAAPKPATSAESASIPAPIRQPDQEVIRRAKLPTFSVEKTIWHPDADRRTAVVKLLDTEEVIRLKEGDAVGPLVVKTIDPNRVLFSHDGIEIQYDVGG